jgi:hypothetical protein
MTKPFPVVLWAHLARQKLKGTEGAISESLRALNIGRIWQQRSQYDRAAGGQRATRPPDMKRRNITLTDRLLPARLVGDASNRQVDFDEAPAR